MAVLPGTFPPTPNCDTPQYVDHWANIFRGCSEPPNLNEVYCCPNGLDGFIDCEGGDCHQADGVNCTFDFPQAKLKSPLNGTSMSPWVRLAFESYN